MKQRSVADQCPIDVFVTRWIKGIYWDRLGNWGDHVTSWLSTRNGSYGFLLLRYEDLIADTAQELAKVAELLGIEPSRERLARAAELSSAERMRELESRQGKKWVQTRYTRQDKAFVRKASSGDWKSKLPPQSVAEIEAAWGQLMISLGYDLSSADAAQSASLHAENSLS
jgi:hypothetical protein